MSLLFSLGKECDPSLEQNCIPFNQGFSVLSLAEIGTVVLEKKIFKSCTRVFTMSLSSPLEYERRPLI